MTRLTHLFAALALWGVLAGAAILACGAHPTSPGETPPLAPRPERLDPAAVPLLRPAGPTADARRSQAPPIGAADPASFSASEQPVGGAQPDAGVGMQRSDASTTSPRDAARPVGIATDASADSYAPPLPPVPDGNLPADSRLEPVRPRD